MFTSENIDYVEYQCNTIRINHNSLFRAVIPGMLIYSVPRKTIAFRNRHGGNFRWIKYRVCFCSKLSLLCAYGRVVKGEFAVCTCRFPESRCATFSRKLSIARAYFFVIDFDLQGGPKKSSHYHSSSLYPKASIRFQHWAPKSGKDNVWSGLG